MPFFPSSSVHLFINQNLYRNSSRDETHNHVDNVTPPDALLTKPTKNTSPSNVAEANASAVAVNGISNDGAFSNNQVDETPVPTTDAPLPAIELQPTEEMSSLALNSSQLLDTNTPATGETQISTLPDAQDAKTSDLLTSVDSAIESAVEDVAASSTVPPVIEAQESDLRHTTSPLAQPLDAQPQEQPSSMDFSFDTAADLPQAEDIAGQTSGADTSDLGLPGTIPDLPDFSTDNHAQQNLSADLATGDDSLNLGPSNDTSLQLGDDTNMGELGTDSMKLETGPLDQVADAPMQPPKVPREREDDDEDEPSAKRAKTDEAADLDQEMADAPPAENGESVTAPAPSISDYQVKEIVKHLKNAGKSVAGGNFKKPVAELWPQLAEAYLQKISNPVDLSVIEHRLKNGGYPSLDAVKDDIRLMASNTTTFNGEGHAIAISARVTRDILINKIDNMKPEPAPVPKKEKVKKEPAPTAPRTAPRRLSKGAGTPAVKPSGPAYALDPSTGTPLIRRDSTNDGGRPKREIHPPKNKDLPYSITRPKNKKTIAELKFCQEVLKEVRDPKYQSFANIFYKAVDPVALQIPNYLHVIKNPMDLTTMATKLKEGEYGSAKDFEKDMRLIIKNCYTFNPVGNPVRDLGAQFDDLFTRQWKKKDQWLAESSPAPASPGGSHDSEDEESEEEEEDPEVSPVAGVSALAKRLIEEQSKLIEMMKDKKTDKSMIQLQHTLIEMLSNSVQNPAPAPRPATKKSKKPRAPAKKAAPVKKAPAPKKTGGNRQKYMGTLEKEVISAGIGLLPEEISTQVLEMIKTEQPGVDASCPSFSIL